MNWPWVSRVRLEDARKEIERLRAENKEQSDKILSLAHESASAETVEESELEQVPVRARATLRGVKAWAQSDVDRKNLTQAKKIKALG